MYIDVNVSHGTWPFQVFTINHINQLEQHLADHDIERALISHLGAVFNPDADHFNQLLFKQTSQNPLFVPIPVINPAMPGWKRHLLSYRDNFNPKAVKILPSYHLYSLQSPEVSNLATQLCSWDLPLLVHLRLEDERSQYRGLNFRGLATNEIIDFNLRFPALKIICLNAYLTEAMQIAEGTNPNVAMDISFAESGNSVDALTETIPPSRLFLGSHTPFLYTLHNIMKIKYSTREMDKLNPIARENARAWFEL